MSSSSNRLEGSRVVEALRSTDALLSVLRALAIDPGAAFVDNRNFRCPWPGHSDDTPSCTVRERMGQYFCQTQGGPGCGASGDGVILPSDLVVAHGRASSRAEAMVFLEGVLGVEPLSASNPPADPVTDPSLTVAQYLAGKGLPAWIGERFLLRDNYCHITPSSSNPRAKYESGRYPAVFMPSGVPGQRPRRRTNEPKGSKGRATGVVKWAMKEFDSSRDLVTDHSPATPDDMQHWAYGLQQFNIGEPEQLPNTLIVVEGESDVHALHAMGITRCLGVPGVSYASNVQRDLVAALLTMNGGDTDLSGLTVATWQESGDAAMRFVKNVAAAISNECERLTVVPPRFAIIPHTCVPTGGAVIDDPSDLLLDRDPQLAAAVLVPAIADRVRDAVSAHTAATAIVAAPAPTPESIQVDPQDDHWSSRLVFDGAPSSSVMPYGLAWMSDTYRRQVDGWTLETTNAKGDTVEKKICTAFVVEFVEEVEDAMYALFAAPIDGRWMRGRIPYSDIGASAKLTSVLNSIGVCIAVRKGPEVAVLAQALADRVIAQQGTRRIPLGMGWTGTPGSSLFGGIEIEPADDMAKMAWDGNNTRRAALPDVPAAAKEWFERLVAPMVTAEPRAGRSARHASPMIAIGTAAAGPLVGPLEKLGSKILPVVWISGLGGTGKTLTQDICASIFAPAGHQAAFYSGADMSRAAMDARTAICRDVPLILDDVTQMPGRPGSQYRGEQARMEAAASLGMQIFNKAPTERATQTGAIAKKKRYRMTAIFSAEATIQDADVTVSAGGVRRLTSIKAEPMKDFVLGDSWPDTVSRFTTSHGGAAGELLVGRIREDHQRGNVGSLIEKARAALRAAAVQCGRDLERTQIESLAISAMGFAMLYDVCGQGSFDEALEVFARIVLPFLSALHDEGGAAANADIAGVDQLLHRVKALSSSESARFLQQRDRLKENIAEASFQLLGGYHVDKSGKRWIAFLKPGMDKLVNEYGVTTAMINEAIDAGVARRRVSVRFGNTNNKCFLFHLSGWLDDVYAGDVEDDFIDESDQHPTIPPESPDQQYLPDQQDLPDQLTTQDQPIKDASMALISTTAVDDPVRVTFDFETGRYEVPAPLADPAALPAEVADHITSEAHEEWTGLKELFPDLDIAPAPEVGSANWERIDAIGADRANSFWTDIANHGSLRAQQSPDYDAAKHLHAYRVLLMCRMRNPHWFVMTAPGVS